MGHDREAVTVGQVSNLEKLCDACKAHYVWLYVMHGAGMDKIPEVRAGVQLLSQSDGSLNGLGEAAVPLDVVEIDGLFNPGDVEIRKPPGGLDGLGQTPSAVGVGHDP